MALKKILLSTLLGGLISFAWGFASWSLLNWHPILSFTNEDAVTAAIRANAPKSGNYLLPGGEQNLGNGDKAAQEKAMMDRMKNGPVVFAAVRAQGMDMASPMLYVNGGIINLVGALFISCLLLMIPGTTYGKRLGLTVMIALIAGILVGLPNWAWWGFSAGYTAVLFLDLAIGWGLAGLVMAKFTNPA